MPSRAFIRRAAVVLLAGAFSCSPFRGEEASSGGAGPAAVDGGSSREGDAGPVVGDANAALCGLQGGATVCDAFEQGTDVSPAWTKREEDGNGGSARVETGLVASGRGALVTRLPTPCSSSYGQLTHQVPEAPARMQIRARVAVVSAPTTTIHIFGTESATANGYYRVDVALSGDHLVVVENDGGTVTPHPASAKLRFGTYALIAVDIAFDNAPHALVSVDGAPQIVADLTVPQLTGNARFELGNYAEASCDKPTETWFDDVVYTLTTR